MTIEQSKADAISAHQVKSVARQPKEVTPPFRDLGIPALAAAARRAPQKAIEPKHELPHFLRLPQKG